MTNNSCCLLILEMSSFQKIVGTFASLIDDVAKEVEKEKMKVCLEIMSPVHHSLNIIKVLYTIVCMAIAY